jgi:type III secretory pathway component EscU
MSVYREKQPTTWVAKLLFKGMSLYAVFSTFASGLNAFLVVIADKGETMIFTAANWILYVGLAVGILFTLVLCYFFEYQEYQKKHPETKVQFGVKYVIAAVCTMLVSAIIAYVITFFGLGYIAPETEITQASIAFIIALAIGGFVTFIVDACIFHPIVDGTAAIAFNKEQEKAREKLASEEAQKAFRDAICDKAKAIGFPLASDMKIEALSILIKGNIDDPMFALYCQTLAGTPEQ